jgi:F420-0:gamma-glutamyl ligase
MIVTAVKTRKVLPKACTLFELLDESLTEIKEKSVVSITSKVVSLCEGRVLPMEGVDKEALIRSEADKYMPTDFGKYGFHFTVTRNTLISMAGIDESNGNGNFVLWPSNPQKTANEVRAYLLDRFKLQDVGVIITDSTCMPPMRSGTVGVMLAHSGFAAVRSEVGRPDIFGRSFKFSKAGVGSGLAATANVVMGEGQEQTPIVLIEDVPFVEFERRDPTPEEISSVYISLDEDLYGPFIKSVPWRDGGGGAGKAANES